MNNEVKTANVILSSDYDLILKLINGVTQKKDLQNTEGILLSSSEGNLVSLTHDFAFNQGNNGAKTSQIVLELLDLDGKFNERYIIASLKRMTIGIQKYNGNLNFKNYEDLLSLKEDAEKRGDFGYIRTIFNNEGGFSDKIESALQIQPTFNPKAPITDTLLFSPDIRPEKQKQLDFWDSLNSRINGLSTSSLNFIGRNSVEELDNGLKLLRESNLELSGIIDNQIRLLRGEFSPATMFIMYGVGDNFDSWAGPYICNLTNIDYKYNGTTGAKSIELTFTPFGSAPLLTGESVFKNGLGVLITGNGVPIFEEIRPPKIVRGSGPAPLTDDSFFGVTIRRQKIKDKREKDIEGIKEAITGVMDWVQKGGEAIMGDWLPKEFKAPDEARNGRLIGKWDEFLGVISQSRHHVVTSLLYDYIKSATIDMDVLILLPDLDVLTEQHLQTQKHLASKFILGKEDFGISSRIHNKAFFCEAYPMIELYRSLGLSIISTNKGKEFKGGSLPMQLVEEFGTYLGDNSVKDTQVAILKYPDQSYKDPIDRMMKTIRENGYPLEFEIEIINNLKYIQELHKIMINHGRNEISGARPILLVGDRAMFHKFMFGRKSLENAGLIKYVFSTGTKEDQRNFLLESLLTERDKVFLDPKYVELAKNTFLSNPPEYPYDFESLPTDTYSFIDSTLSQKRLKEAGVTVFRLGTENANILDINSNLSMAYFTALQQIWFSEAFSGRSHSGGVSLVPGDALNPNNTNTRNNKQIIDFISIQDPKTLRDKVNEFNKDGKLTSDLGITNQTLEEIISFGITLLTYSKENRRMSIPIDWSTGDNAFVQLIRLLSIIHRSAVMSTIKTLPAFHLSDCTFSLPTVLMVIGEPGLIGKTNDYTITKTLSGFWRITGFQHKISNFDISSSFHLVKDISSGLPILFDIPNTNEAIK